MQPKSVIVTIRGGGELLLFFVINVKAVAAHMGAVDRATDLPSSSPPTGRCALLPSSAPLGPYAYSRKLESFLGIQNTPA
jgi:hypothetical protein